MDAAKLPEMSATLAVAADHLRVRYEFGNTTGEPLLLFNLLSLRGEADTHLVYHSVEGWRPGLSPKDDQPTLVVSKEPMPMKPGVSVYRPDMPFATRIEPGQRISDELTVAIPVPLYNPHAPFGAQEGLREVTCRQVRFRLGYALERDLGATGEPVPALGRDVYLYPFRIALEARRTIDSAPTFGALLVEL